MNESPNQLVCARDRLLERHRLAWVLIISLIGSFLCLAAQGDLPENSSSFIAQLLGGAVAPFLVAIFVSSFFRGWASITTGILIAGIFICLQMSGILTAKQDRKPRGETPRENHHGSSE